MANPHGIATRVQMIGVKNPFERAGLALTLVIPAYQHPSYRAPSTSILSHLVFSCRVLKRALKCHFEYPFLTKLKYNNQNKQSDIK